MLRFYLRLLHFCENRIEISKLVWIIQVFKMWKNNFISYRQIFQFKNHLDHTLIFSLSISIAPFSPDTDFPSNCHISIRPTITFCLDIWRPLCKPEKNFFRYQFGGNELIASRGRFFAGK